MSNSFETMGGVVIKTDKNIEDYASEIEKFQEEKRKKDKELIELFKKRDEKGVSGKKREEIKDIIKEKRREITFLKNKINELKQKPIEEIAGKEEPVKEDEVKENVVEPEKTQPGKPRETITEAEPAIEPTTEPAPDLSAQGQGATIENQEAEEKKWIDFEEKFKEEGDKMIKKHIREITNGNFETDKFLGDDISRLEKEVTDEVKNSLKEAGINSENEENQEKGREIFLGVLKRVQREVEEYKEKRKQEIESLKPLLESGEHLDIIKDIIKKAGFYSEGFNYDSHVHSDKNINSAKIVFTERNKSDEIFSITVDFGNKTIEENGITDGIFLENLYKTRGALISEKGEASDKIDESKSFEEREENKKELHKINMELWTVNSKMNSLYEKIIKSGTDGLGDKRKETIKEIGGVIENLKSSSAIFMSGMEGADLVDDKIEKQGGFKSEAGELSMEDQAKVDKKFNEIRNSYTEKSKKIEKRYDSLPLGDKKTLLETLREGDILDSSILESFGLDPNNEEYKERALEMQKEIYTELADRLENKNVITPEVVVEAPEREVPRGITEAIQTLEETEEKLFKVIAGIPNKDKMLAIDYNEGKRLSPEEVEVAKGVNTLQELKTTVSIDTLSAMIAKSRYMSFEEGRKMRRAVLEEMAFLKDREERALFHAEKNLKDMVARKEIEPMKIVAVNRFAERVGKAGVRVTETQAAPIASPEKGRQGGQEKKSRLSSVLNRILGRKELTPEQKEVEKINKKIGVEESRIKWFENKNDKLWEEFQKKEKDLEEAKKSNNKKKADKIEAEIKKFRDEKTPDIKKNNEEIEKSKKELIELRASNESLANVEQEEPESGEGIVESLNKQIETAQNTDDLQGVFDSMGTGLFEFGEKYKEDFREEVIKKLTDKDYDAAISYSEKEISDIEKTKPSKENKINEKNKKVFIKFYEKVIEIAGRRKGEEGDDGLEVGEPVKKDIPRRGRRPSEEDLEPEPNNKEKYAKTLISIFNERISENVEKFNEGKMSGKEVYELAKQIRDIKNAPAAKIPEVARGYSDVMIFKFDNETRAKMTVAIIDYAMANNIDNKETLDLAINLTQRTEKGLEDWISGETMNWLKGGEKETKEKESGELPQKLEGIFGYLKKNNPEQFKALKDYINNGINEKGTIGEDYKGGGRFFLEIFGTRNAKLDLDFEAIKEMKSSEFFGMAKEAYERAESGSKKDPDKKSPKPEGEAEKEMAQKLKEKTELYNKVSEELDKIKDLESFKKNFRRILEPLVEEKKREFGYFPAVFNAFSDGSGKEARRKAIQSYQKTDKEFFDILSKICDKMDEREEVIKNKKPEGEAGGGEKGGEVERSEPKNRVIEKGESAKETKIIIAKDVNRELEKHIDLTEKESREFKNRQIVIPDSINKQLEELANEDREVQGILFYKKEGSRCLVEGMFLTGSGDDRGGFVDTDLFSKEIADRFLKNEEYDFISFHTHPKYLGDSWSEKFSDFADIPGIIEWNKEKKDLMHLMAAPKKRTIAGIGNPGLIIGKDQNDYKKTEEQISNALQNIELEYQKVDKVLNANLQIIKNSSNIEDIIKSVAETGTKLDYKNNKEANKIVRFLIAISDDFEEKTKQMKGKVTGIGEKEFLTKSEKEYFDVLFGKLKELNRKKKEQPVSDPRVTV